MDAVTEAGRGSRSFSGIKEARLFARFLEFHNHSAMGSRLLSVIRSRCIPRTDVGCTCRAPLARTIAGNSAERHNSPLIELKLQYLRAERYGRPSSVCLAFHLFRSPLCPLLTDRCGWDWFLQSANPPHLSFCSPPRKVEILPAQGPAHCLNVMCLKDGNDFNYTQNFLGVQSVHTIDRT